MKASRYCHPKLRATRRGLADPAAEVASWIEGLDRVLATTPSRWSKHDVRTLLALWATLRRVAPGLLAAHDGNQRLRRAEELLKQQKGWLRSVNLWRFDAGAWMEKGKRLGALFEESPDPADLQVSARQLIAAFDDAELVLHAQMRWTPGDGTSAEATDACRNWLMEHADLFVPASTYIQAVGLTLRPDLFETDYDLALTALKYEALLDAIEELEATLAFENVPSLPRSTARRLAQCLPTPRPAADTGAQGAPTAAETSGAGAPAPPKQRIAFSRSLLPPTGLAAAKGRPRCPIILRWDHPSSGYYAVLPLPAREVAVVTVSCFDAQGQPAAGLSGTSVCLAGVAATLDANGKARLRLEEIRRTGEELRLDVGRERNTWLPDLSLL